MPGDRAAEAVIAREANATNNGVYSIWVNANSHVAYKQFVNAIERKAGKSTVAKANFLLDKKQALYARDSGGFVADILLIHSCELWLNALDLETWLAEAVFAPCSTIRSCYFALGRLPDYPKDHWPLFRLYG